MSRVYSVKTFREQSDPSAAPATNFRHFFAKSTGFYMETPAATISKIVDGSDFTAGGQILASTAANTYSGLAAGTSGQFLKTTGSGAQPSWDWVSTIRNSGNTTYASISGDVLSIYAASAVRITVDTNGTTLSSLANVESSTYTGILVSVTGLIKYRTKTEIQSDIGLPAATLGSLIYGSGAGTYASLTGNTEFKRKLLSQIGDGGGGSNAPSWLSGTHGDVMYYSAAGWTSLAAGTSGQYLKTLGAGANPIWDSPSGSSHNLLSATHTDTVTGSAVLGDIIYANATPNWTKLAGNTTATKKFLSQTGTGSVSAVPVWDTISTTNITDLSSWTGSTSITTLGTIVTGTWSANAIVSTKGGTGLTSFAQYSMLYASAANTWAELIKGSADYQVLTAAATTRMPTWALITNDNISASAGIALSKIGGGGQGSVIYHNGTSWTILTYGTAGYYLRTAGVSANPTWAQVAFSELSGTSNVVQINQANAYGDYNQTFRSGRLRVANPANTYFYTFVGSAIVANRNVTLPLLTGNDVFVMADFIQTVTNKTINLTNNTVTDTSMATGDLVKSNGTRFVRFARGTAYYVLRNNSGGTDLEWALLDLANSVTGTLPVSKGGTGATSFNAYGVILAGTTSTGALQSTVAGTANYVLQANGASANPSWTLITNDNVSSTAGIVLSKLGNAASGSIIYGNATPAWTTLSGNAAATRAILTMASSVPAWTTGASGDILYYHATNGWSSLIKGTTGQVLKQGTNYPEWGAAGGTGDVVGPSSSSDNEIVRFDGTTGKLIQAGGGWYLTDDNKLTNHTGYVLNTFNVNGSMYINGIMYFNTYGTLRGDNDSRGLKLQQSGNHDEGSLFELLAWTSGTVTEDTATLILTSAGATYVGEAWMMTATKNNQILGLVDFQGYTSGGEALGARLLVKTSQDWGTNVGQSSFYFYTNPGGGGAMVNGFAITYDGKIGLYRSMTDNSCYVSGIREYSEGIRTVAGGASDEELVTEKAVADAIEDATGGGIQLGEIDAKGDLLVGTAAGSVDNLAVGSNYYVLTADSTAGGGSFGMKWALIANDNVSTSAAIGWSKMAGGTYGGRIVGTVSDGSKGLGETALYIGFTEGGGTGYLGVGTGGAPSYRLHVTQVSTDDSLYATFSSMTFTPSSAVTEFNPAAVYGYSTHSGSNSLNGNLFGGKFVTKFNTTSKTVTTLTGIASYSYLDAANATLVVGGYFYAGHSSNATAGTATITYGILVQSGAIATKTYTTTSSYLAYLSYGTDGTYTVTNKYGLYISDVSTGLNVNYAIFTNAGWVSFGDKVLTSASTTTRAGINIPHGTAPSSPVNGDIWTTTAGMYVYVNGWTVGPLGAGGATDKISEGNSSVEVVDTGTGQINFEIDGSVLLHFKQSHSDIGSYPSFYRNQGSDICMYADSGRDFSLILATYGASDTTDKAAVKFFRRDTGSIGNGDELGMIGAYAYYSASYLLGGRILFKALAEITGESNDSLMEIDFQVGGSSQLTLTGGYTKLPKYGLYYSNALGTDDTWNGDVIDGYMGETVAQFDTLYVYAANTAQAEYRKADASAGTTMPVVALALVAGSGTQKIILRGRIRNDAWNWTVGAGESSLIYASETTGALTQTKPTTTGARVQIVGYALTADIMFFDPCLAYVEIV